MTLMMSQDPDQRPKMMLTTEAQLSGEFVLPGDIVTGQVFDCGFLMCLRILGVLGVNIQKDVEKHGFSPWFPQENDLDMVVKPISMLGCRLVFAEYSTSSRYLRTFKEQFIETDRIHSDPTRPAGTRPQRAHSSMLEVKDAGSFTNPIVHSY